jgi:ArsR family transcriptional regulator, arsenate/arsenite/antimonite-responsive transcriptional repressor / arsenate reductase (thioredoxin)
MDDLFLDCYKGQPLLCPPPDITLKEPDLPTRKQNVIFICTGNSARSILAESILRTEAPERFNAYSAGTRPAGTPNPVALEILHREGHDTRDLRSKNLDEFQKPGAAKMDFIFTVCDAAANEECPLWPGQPISGHWGIPDPAAVKGSNADKYRAFALAYLRMRARILAFLALKRSGADETDLQNQIDAIGRMALETPE